MQSVVFNQPKNINFRFLYVLAGVLTFSISFSFSAEQSITDATGTILTLDAPPERVVSLNPDFTDILFAFGLGKKVVGVTTACRIPELKTTVKRVGTLYQPALETITVLRPDLILATMEGNNPRTIAALRRLKIPTYVSPPQRSLGEYYSILKVLGRLFGEEEKAAELADEFRTVADDIAGRVSGSKKVSVFIQLGSRPLVSVSSGTLIDELVEIAGGENICGDIPGRYPVVSREEVILKDPEVIVITGMEGGRGDVNSCWKDLKNLRAVREGKIFRIDPDKICHLGPGLKSGLTDLARLLHPELFPENPRQAGE